MYGAIAGHVAAGRYVLQSGDPDGALIREASRTERAHFRPRPVPVLVRPRLIRGLLGRRAELRVALSALEAGFPIEVSGEPGIGKTAVLRHLSNDPQSASFVDGCVYIDARHQSSADLQQLVFDAFFDSDRICAPTDADIRLGMQDKRALILLDDVEVAPHELEQIIDLAPRSAFAVAVRDRCLWGEVRSLPLRGLPDADAVLLLEREIERTLDADERIAGAKLCVRLGGHPLRILQAAALIRELGTPVAECAAGLTPASLIAKLIASTDEKQRRALSALTALPGVPLQAQDIAGIAEVTDLEPSLMALVRRGLIVSSQSRHRLAEGVGDQLRRTEDLKPWAHRAITYFTAYAERHRRDPVILRDESEALLRSQQCATDTRRWGEVLRLGRLLEGALVLGGRWGAWEIVLERCLSAAQATGDRSGEAWALHQMGTRIVCLGESAAARTLLRRALALREALQDEAGAMSTRRNLNFVLTPVSDDSLGQAASRPDTVPDLDSLPLRAHAKPVPPLAGTNRVRAGLVGVIALTLLTWLALWAAPPSVAWRTWTAGNLAEWLHGRAAGLTAGNASAAVAGAGTESATAREPQRRDSVPEDSSTGRPAPASDKPVIRIFSQRPGPLAARGPTTLCYAVSGALQARVEPDVGLVSPTSTLTCLRVAPSRTTTYELTALGRGGDQTRQQLVVVVR